MADLIKIKSGALGDRESMPNLTEDELGYCTDEQALYIGTKGGNVRLCGVADALKLAEITTKIADITTRLEELLPSEEERSG